MTTLKIKGMVSIAQISRINGLFNGPNHIFPVSAFLKNVTNGRAACIDELTCAQANEVIRILGKWDK